MTNDRYAFKKRIYSKKFDIWEGIDIKTRTKVAIKKINKKSLDENSLTLLLYEINVYGSLDHPNVVKMLDNFQSANNYYLIFEYLPFTLLDINICHDETLCKHFFRQLVSAVKYCHSKGIIHRDIKPDNILVDENGNAKLCDFEFARIQHKDTKLYKSCGSIHYVSPEILMSVSNETGYDGYLSDVWSCGITLYTMYMGQYPFETQNWDAKDYNFFNLKLHSCMSLLLCNLLKKMINIYPSNRYNIIQVEQHGWLAWQPEENNMEISRPRRMSI